MIQKNVYWEIDNAKQETYFSYRTRSVDLLISNDTIDS